MPFQELYQNDARWKGNILGFGAVGQTIEYFGCLLTSMTMIGNYFVGSSETPASLNNRLKQLDGFRQQFVKAASIGKVFAGVKYQYNAKKPVPIDLIDAGLAAGSLIAVLVDYETRPGLQGHWVVIHQKQGNDYLIWDPWRKDGAPNTLVGRYGFNGGVTDIIHEAIWFGEKDFPPAAQPASTPTISAAVSAVTARPAATPSPPTPAATSPAVSSSLVVEPFVLQLTLRQQPNSLSPALRQLNRGEDLLVLESAAAAQAKLGQENQWLRVRHASGIEGYVAAWYITPSNDPVAGVQVKTLTAPAPSAAPTPSSPALQVRTIGEGVALRREARVAHNTLIRYLPAGTILTVMEGGNAVAKIGIQNQWLKVRTSDGVEGFVAAWFVR